MSDQKQLEASPTRRTKVAKQKQRSSEATGSDDLMSDRGQEAVPRQFSGSNGLGIEFVR